jgi:hypothetical protein
MALVSEYACASSRIKQPFSQETLLCYAVGTNNPHAVRHALGQKACFSYPLISAWLHQAEQFSQGRVLLRAHQAIGVMLGSIVPRYENYSVCTVIPSYGALQLWLAFKHTLEPYTMRTIQLDAYYLCNPVSRFSNMIRVSAEECNALFRSTIDATYNPLSSPSTLTTGETIVYGGLLREQESSELPTHFSRPHFFASRVPPRESCVGVVHRSPSGIDRLSDCLAYRGLRRDTPETTESQMDDLHYIENFEIARVDNTWRASQFFPLLAPSKPAPLLTPYSLTESFSEGFKTLWQGRVQEDQIRFYVDIYQADPLVIPVKPNRLQKLALERLSHKEG